MRVWVAVLCLVAPPAAADEKESPIPRLGEHAFVPTMSISDPFMTTEVQTGVSLGETLNSTIPVESVIDSTATVSTESQQFFTAIEFRFQQRAKDWLAVRFSLGAAGRLGTDTPTLLVDGITGVLDYNLGWKMRIHQSRSVLVSGSVSLGNSNATFINLLEWAELISQGQEASLARTRSSLRGVGGVHAAWGLNRRFGLLGSCDLEYGESFDGLGENGWFTDVRLALSYDAARDIKAPLGVAITGGRYDNRVDADSDHGVWFWSTRIGVQTRADFTVGLDVTTSYYESDRQSSNVQFAQFTIDMRYYY